MFRYRFDQRLSAVNTSAVSGGRPHSFCGTAESRTGVGLPHSGVGDPRTLGRSFVIVSQRFNLADCSRTIRSHRRAKNLAKFDSAGQRTFGRDRWCPGSMPLNDAGTTRNQCDSQKHSDCRKAFHTLDARFRSMNRQFGETACDTISAAAPATSPRAESGWCPRRSG
jgi:hypothetical protein